MTLLGFIVLLIIAGLCGAIGQAVAGRSVGGFLVSIALGFVGALLGTWLAGVLHLPEIFAIRIGPQVFPVVWSVIGAALFVALLGLFRRRAY